jgi:UDP-3-O-acyl-N-acetylglucosamine deacetylase
MSIQNNLFMIQFQYMKKIIISIIVIILLLVGVNYSLNRNLIPCVLIMNQENQEICYFKSALKTNNSNICSNMKEIYRQKRCTDILKSQDAQMIESILKSL